MYCRKATLDIEQKAFAEKCGMHTHILSTVETELYNSTKETILKIAKVFWNEGLYFLPEGGFRMDKNIVTVYEGEGCYTKLQDDILRTCSENKDEVLYLGADDSKSSDKIIEKEKEIYDAGIPCKNLISEDNNYILGYLKDYRQIDSKFFIPIDLTIIYDSKVAFDIYDKNKKTIKIIIIRDKHIVTKMREYFYSLWNSATIIQKSSVKQILFHKKK